VTRFLRHAALAILCVTAAVALAVPFLLPAHTSSTPPPHWPDELTVRGAYHVHSNASDGTGSLDDIAAAAARAGLQFVIVTDHGDGTRMVDPPRYRAGVLVIEGVEVNTSGGHLVGLGARTSPYPLAGDPSAVLEDLHRLGAMTIAAHPGSPRASLRWTEWSLPLDGVEWLNADSEWRDEILGSLGRLLLTYALRPAETLTATLDRPAEVLHQWDAMMRVRRVVGLAGADAHARLGFRRQTDPYEEGWHVPVPSYEASFGAFGLRVSLDARLSGDPSRDAADILARIRWGRTYSVIDGLASPGALDFRASSGAQVARMGDYLDVTDRVVLHVRVAAPDAARVVILQNGLVLHETRDREIHIGVPSDPAAYRVEVHIPETAGEPPIPWLVSNPIYVGLREPHRLNAAQTAAAAEVRRLGVATESWVAEASPGSTSVLDPRGVVGDVEALTWRYTTAGGSPAGQYAAMRFPVNGLRGIDGLELHARAAAPMRVWLQVRASSRGGERWGRTLYLDETFQTVRVGIDQLRPVGVTSTERPPLEAIDVMLLVVDTVNTRPGSSGAVQFQSLWLLQEREK
jgi:hypothetical protein